jgi:hypothetical protein
MQNTLFNMAVKNGQYVSIDRFAPGIGSDCDCICPDCGERVVSNVTAKTREQLKIDFTNHFSHLNKNSNCSGGYEETTIHLLAKKIIESNSSINVPGTISNQSEIIMYGDVRIEPAFPNEKYKRYRPDIIIKSNDDDIAIEVVVTCAVTGIKSQLYRDHKFKSLIIDLSRFRGKPLKEVEYTLEQEVLKLTGSKKWIWPEQVEVQVTSNTKSEEDKGLIWTIILSVVAFFAGRFLLKKINGFFIGSTKRKQKRRF